MWHFLLSWNSQFSCFLYFQLIYQYSEQQKEDLLWQEIYSLPLSMASLAMVASTPLIWSTPQSPFINRIQYLQPTSHCSHSILIRISVKQSLIRSQFFKTNSLVWPHQTCAKLIPQACSFHNSLIDFFIISLNFRINLNYFHQIWKPSQFQRIFTYFVHSLQTLTSCLLDDQSITKEIFPVTLAYTSFWAKHSKKSSFNLFMNNR